MCVLAMVTTMSSSGWVLMITRRVGHPRATFTPSSRPPLQLARMISAAFAVKPCVAQSDHARTSASSFASRLSPALASAVQNGSPTLTGPTGCNARCRRRLRRTNELVTSSMLSTAILMPSRMSALDGLANRLGARTTLRAVHQVLETLLECQQLLQPNLGPY